MKIKHGLIITAVLVPLCAVLRFVQYLYVIDGSGYYSTDSMLGRVLQYSLVALYALTALAALILMITGDKKNVGYERAFSSRSQGIIYLIAAVLMTGECGVRAGRMLIYGTIDYIAVAEAPALLFFAVLSFSVLSGTVCKRLLGILGIFPPVFVCTRAIICFFESFSKVHVSENKLEMLMLCTLALYVTLISVTRVGVTVSTKRTVAVSMLFAVFSSVTTLSRLAAIISGRMTGTNIVTDVIWIAVQLVLAVSAVITLLRLTYIPADAEKEPVNPVDEINLYIDDIPEIKDNTEENGND